MSKNRYYAHSRDDGYQLLRDHLSQTALRCAENGKLSGVGNLDGICELLGLLHDAGKYSKSFQLRIRGSKIRAPHAMIGAFVLGDSYGLLGRLLAYCVAGHHGGLPDYYEDLARKMDETRTMPNISDTLNSFYFEIELPTNVNLPRFGKPVHGGMCLALLVRMLFSMLVDADWLDTESYCQPEIGSARAMASANLPTMVQLLNRFHQYRSNHFGSSASGINFWRNLVYQDCVAASLGPKGIYTLTVPTGGGKTLSSMAFALEHAAYHRMRRVIYAIPYTSIIEQNAAVFSRVLGKDAVLEHHSNVAYDDTEKEEATVNRLAAENWNAPVIVTTNVQFFESLFSNRPSRCRKLHNIANSVIILDEAQMIPDGFLKPCLAVLQCLQRDYGCTIVICTATQPAFHSLWLGEQTCTEIVRDVPALFQAFKRVSVDTVGELNHEALAQRLDEHHQALCIVNTRGAATSVFDLLPATDGCFHLSTLMCAAHRAKALDKIRHRLINNLPCRVVSTQLIEAGVDIDFPVVYRAFAGVDSIAQAAGRCNREGKRTLGHVHVFRPAEGLPRGFLQTSASLGMQLLDEYDDILGQDAVSHYFEQRYRDGGIGALDKEGIMDLLKAGEQGHIAFREIAQRFHFIESATEQIVIPFDEEARSLIEQAIASDYPAVFMRRLQRYLVGVYRKDYEDLRERGYLREGILPCAVLAVSDEEFPRIYDEKTGLVVSADMTTLLA